MIDLVHRFGPQNYYHYSGVINTLPKFLEDNHLQFPLVIHGEKSWQAVQPYWPETEFQHPYKKILFAGECSYEEIDRIGSEVIHHQHDAIIGVGGGKLLDTVKAVASKAKIPCILIPTLPSNCASFTPISIVYSAEGDHLGTIRHSQSNYMVMVEPELLVNAPIEHLTSGIGDTLAKWYESKIRFNKLTSEEISILLELSHTAAKQCRDNILKWGEAAVQAAEAKKSNADFSRMIDTIYAVAGLVGGLGGEFGQSVGAHAFNYGYVSLGKKGHLHGSLVAYGILFQLSLEENYEEIKQLVPLYKKLKLPICWRDLHLSPEKGDLDKMADQILRPSSRIYALPMELTKQSVIDGLQKLEAFITENEVGLNVF
ncbi:oxidoreductase [Niallia circulans]|uniref:iron-containing alcohol dehydrogenase family protein n=1 Tax=Niallia circulans TaxID=1397 RepID=UPI000F452C08|nr:iron-containing alcohol dehydrogenase family protein [Niallia circulans]AYV68107.1 oxidoreductase [Niallia circulans]